MKKLVFLICAVTFLTAGCADGQEIDERNFVISVGIDKGADDTFEISMGLANPEVGKEDDTVGKETKTGSGSTLLKAMKENESNYSRNTYYGHTKTIILSDEVLREEGLLEEIVDTLMRSNEFSLKTIILSSLGSAKECIEAVQTEDNGDGLYIWDYYKNNVAHVENTVRLTLKDLELAVNAGNSLVIPTIKVEDGKPVIGGGAVFDGQNLAGELSSEDMTYYSLTIRDCEGYLIQVDADGEEIPVFLKKTSCKIKVQENTIVFQVNIKGDIKGQGSIDLVEDAEIHRVEQALKEQLEDKIHQTMTKIKEMGLPEFEDKNISVQVSSKIRGTGVIR